MSTQTDTPVETQDVNLDDFSADFFGQKPAASETTNSDEVVEDADVESDANEDIENDVDDVTQPDPSEEDDEDDNTLDAEDAETEDPDNTPTPKKKSRFQERIDELTEARRTAERDRDDLLARMAALEASLKKEDVPEPVPTPKSEGTNAGPNPDDLDADGNLKYPLGEFDPKYIVDSTLFTIRQEQNNSQQEQARLAEQAKKDQAQAELISEWNNKLVPAQERYPDFQVKGQQLLNSLGDVDEAYGQYLTNTIMSMEHGPDVFYALASNPAEAKKIVDSGAAAATLALGRLEARFMEAKEENLTKRPKVSNAPTPPPRNKGTSAARASVAPDTDDLDAFSSTFFKKK